MEKHACYLCHRITLTKKIAGGYICENCINSIKIHYIEPKVK